MTPLSPGSPAELAELLKQASASGKTMAIAGNDSKRLMAGPVTDADLSITTRRMRSILQYERDDLTISVQAGMPFAELQTVLAREGQMIALDPPFFTNGTIGGVVASNVNGPIRRGYGTARDLCIGMSFVTLEGRVIRTGGMVVKNVAGLDMSKLMIGSFGTLAVITSLNFRVHPLPQLTRTFLFSCADVDSAIQRRDAILKSPLKPIAVDLLSPPAATRLGHRGFLLAIRAEGSQAVLERYLRELSGAEPLFESDEKRFWDKVCEFTPDFLGRQPGGIVLRVSTTLNEISRVLRCTSAACISRAASGVTYVYLSSWQSLPPLLSTARECRWTAVVEYAPDEIRNEAELWFSNSCPAVSDGFAIMERVKTMFDPNRLLNRSRLYGRI